MSANSPRHRKNLEKKSRKKHNENRRKMIKDRKPRNGPKHLATAKHRAETFRKV